MDLLSTPVLVGAALAVLIGVSLGLLGGGGSLLTIPILVYVVGVAPHEAITLSLLIVGTTSLAALVPHARARRVRWQTGALFAATSMTGAFGAGKVAHFIPGPLLLLLLGVMMVVTALAMMRGKTRGESSGSANEADAERRVPLAKLVAEGLAVGALTGLVGAGGGFVVVPALVLLAKLPMRAAVGTSLFVIALNSLAAFAAHASTTHIDWGFAALATSAAVAGSVVGGSLASRVPQHLLRRGFAWFVLVIAAFVLAQEVPRALGYHLSLASAWPAVLGICGLPLAAAVVDLTRRTRRAALPPARISTSPAH
jgi:uncharacterized membrane protein YfcA